MTEGCGPEGQYRGTNLSVGDNLDSEDVGEAGTAIVAESAKDEVFALLVEDQDARQHGGGIVGAMERWRGGRYNREVKCGDGFMFSPTEQGA